MNVQEVIAEVLEYARGMWRFRWWALAVAWLLSLLGSLYVYAMPDVYSASARVYVDTKSLMGPIFKGLAISDNLSAQVEAVSRALLTRPNVEAVARRTDLDLRADTPEQMEHLITKLQETIKVQGNREQNVFSISYEDRNREKAQEVVAAIVDAFVENSLEGQGSDAEMTGRALDAEVKEHEARLARAESALAEFKKEHLGYMPDDRGDYYTRLQQEMAAVSETQSQMREVSERRDELQRQLDASRQAALTPDGGASVGCSQQAQIEKLEGELALLRVDYTDKHPSIVSLKEIIGSLRDQCGAEWSHATETGRGAPVSMEQPVQANTAYQNIRIQLTNAEVELVSLKSRLATHQDSVARLRADVNKIAEVEANLKQLNRDYSVIQARYLELLERREQLQSKERLDPVTDAVQFRTLEPPFAGVDPVGPNRPLLLAFVLVVSMGAGGALAFGLSQLKPVFFTRRSLRRIGGLPVLGSVSLLLSPEQVRRRRRQAWLWGASCAALVVLTALAILFEGPGAAMLRVLLEGTA